MSRYRSDDVELLLPTFRERVKLVLAEMRERGYQPVLFDGLRTPAEAQKNAAKGTGIANSMHLYGLAADIICDEHGWSCGAKKCGFFKALGEAYEAEGILWGGRWRRADLPHGQGVSIAQQAAVRKLGTGAGSRYARDGISRKFFSGATK